MELDLPLWHLANSVRDALESVPAYREGIRENKNK